MSFSSSLFAAGLVGAALLSTSAAAAEPFVRTAPVRPGGVDRPRLRVSVDGPNVVVEACMQSDCASAPVAQVPEPAASLEPRVRFVSLAAGGEAALVEFAAGPRSEAEYTLVFAQPSAPKKAPELILRGSSAGGTTVLVQSVRGNQVIVAVTRPPQPNLCGRRVATSVRRFGDGSPRFHRIAVPSLEKAERARATSVDAGAVSTEVLGRLLRTPHVLADGDVSTTLRGNDFLVLQTEDLQGAAALQVLADDEVAGDLTDKHEAWLVVDDSVFRIPAGRAVRVPLPELTSDTCVAVVQGSKPWMGEVLIEAAEQKGAPRAEELQRLALRLSAGDALAARTVGAAGPDGIDILAAATPRYSAVGRRELTALAGRLAPSAAIPLWTALLEFGDEQDRRTARERLLGFGGQVVPIVEARLSPATPAARGRFLGLLGELDPAVAADRLVADLGENSPASRLRTRTAIVALAADEDGLAALSGILESGRSKSGQRVPRRALSELARALAPRIPRLSDAARGSAAQLVTTAGYREAYRTTDVALVLAAEDASIAKVLRGWLRQEGFEAEPREWSALSVHVLEQAEQVQELSLEADAMVLLAAEQMRVRKAAAVYLRARPSAQAVPPLAELLDSDPWPAVRVAGVEALGKIMRSGAAGAAAESPVLDALKKDASPLVRKASAGAMAESSSEDSLFALRRSFGKDRDLSVRAAAARALGKRCDAESIERLTRAAQELSRAPVDPSAVDLGVESAVALARINPPDFDERMEFLDGDALPGVLRLRVSGEVDRVRGSCAQSETQ